MKNLFLLSLIFCAFSCKNIGAETIKDFIPLYNGENLNNWDCHCKGEDPELAKKVFSLEKNKEIHVFKDFPDKYGVSENKNETHCMIFTKKKYSRYIFKFDYKWGSKLFNNYDTYQYDAGMYFHVFNTKIWPEGIEYQVRYNHIKDLNHTGDIWNSGSSFDWYASIHDKALENKTYTPLKEGGVLQAHKGGEHRASINAKYNALNGKWNHCEVIVMGNSYAIFKLNNMVVNVITNIKHKEGVIGLQAETAEIFYKNIKIKEFSEDIPISQFLNN